MAGRQIFLGTRAATAVELLTGEDGATTLDSVQQLVHLHFSLLTIKFQEILEHLLLEVSKIFDCHRRLGLRVGSLPALSDLHADVRGDIVVRLLRM